MVLDQYLRDYGMSPRDGTDAWEGFCQHEYSIHTASEFLFEKKMGRVGVAA